MNMNHEYFHQNYDTKSISEEKICIHLKQFYNRRKKVKLGNSIKQKLTRKK